MNILRNLIGALGLVAAAGVIALAAATGYATGATPADSFATALLYSIIGLTGLAGPAAARRLYRSSRLRPLGVLLGIISAAGLVTNVTHLTRAAPEKAASGPSTQAASAPPLLAPNKDELELQRITSERSALYFSGTSVNALGAARAAYLAAQAAHYAQCVGGREPNCAKLAADLATTQTAFLAAVRDRTSTEQAEKLDAEAARIRARLAPASPPSRAVPSQGADAGRQDPILGYVSRETVAWRQIFVTLAAQIAIAISLILWDLPSRPPKTAVREAGGAMPGRAMRREQASEGDLTRFVQACISPATGESVEMRALYLRFLDWCDEQRLSALPPRAFTRAFVERCAEAQIEVRQDGPDIVCLDVTLAPGRRA